MIQECSCDVYVSTTATVQKLCPFVDEVDEGTITIGWHANGSTLELHAIHEWLATWKDRKASHEVFTESVQMYLSAQLGWPVKVRSEWVTAGMTVTVTAP